MATTPIYNLTDTWNTTLSSLDGIRMDITDNESTSDSRLLMLSASSGAKLIFNKTGLGVNDLPDANKALTVNGDTIIKGSLVDENGYFLTSSSLSGGTGIDITAAEQGASISLDLSELTTSTSNADGDYFAVVDTSNNQKKLTKANINISGFNNDSGFTS